MVINERRMGDMSWLISPKLWEPKDKMIIAWI
jgi:hypothetical protein